MTDEEKKREEDVWQEIKDFKETFESPEGKRVVERLKRLSNYDYVLVPVDNNGRIDVNQVMFNEGQRSVMVHILRKLKTDLGKPKQTEAVRE